MSDPIKFGILGAFATHIAHRIAERFRPIGTQIATTAERYTPTSVQKVAKAFFQKLADCTDTLQTSMTLIHKWKTAVRERLVIDGDPIATVELQQKWEAIWLFLTPVMVAPIVEELLYRFPQLALALSLQKMAGTNPVLAHIIFGVFTNTMFGLAHIGEKDETGRMITPLGLRLRSQEFQDSFSKGIAIALTAMIASMSRQNKVDKTSQEPSSQTRKILLYGLACAILAHSLSNLPEAARQSYNQWIQ